MELSSSQEKAFDFLLQIIWSALPDYLTLYKKKKPYKTLLRAYFNFHDKVQFEVGKASRIAIQGLTVVILLMILLAKLGIS